MPSLRSNWLSHAALAAGLIASSLGGAVLVSWQLGFSFLLQVRPTLVPMHRMTALAVVLAGVALVCDALLYKRAALLCALLPLSIGVLALAEYALSVSLGIDQLLGPDYLNVHTSSPGRMSPASAVCLIGFSVAAIALSSDSLAKWASAIAGVIGSTLLTIGLVSVWAMLQLHREVFAWGNVTRVSIPSSVSYALLGAGLLALAGKERRGRVSGWAAAAVGLSAAAGVLGVWQAMVEHNEGDWPLVSNAVLAGGLLMALLLAVAIYQTQWARSRHEALRQSEERFREIFEQSPIGIALVGGDFRLFKTNPAYARMLGYSERELAAMTPLDVTYRDDREMTQGILHRFFKTDTHIQRLEKRYVTKSGQVIWVTITNSSVHDTRGKPLYSIALVEDITERKRAEDESRMLMQRLSLATRSASMGIWEWNLSTNLSIWDDMMFQIFGLPKHAGVKRQEWVSLILPEDKAKVKAFSDTIFQDKTQDEVEFRIMRPDGALRHVSALGGAALDERGNVTGMVGIAVDITERKQEEEKLRSLTARFAQATQFASMAVWELDPRTRVYLWDDTAFAMGGMSKTDFVPYETWAQTVHRDDLATTEAALQRIVRDKTQESTEYRMFRPDGALRTIYAAGGPVLDSAGEVIRVVGIAIDITERKKEEEKLRSLTARFAQATQFAAIAVWEFNPRTGLYLWDETAFDMVGMPKRDFVPYETWVQAIHPDDRIGNEATLQRIINDKTQESLEFRFYRADGALRYLYAAGGPVLDSAGEVIRVVGIAIDITERKRLEADLEATREQAAASARLSALGMMAGGVAHEINNPLSIIHAMASDLTEMVATQGSAPPQVVAHKSSVIRVTAERIAKIVKSLRQISREGSGDTFLPTPVAKIVSETLQICEAKFAAHGVDLRLPRPIPELKVPCREVQIAQALLNLLQNAFDAVLEQEGDRWVRLDVESHDSSVVISVVDSGPGIPLELRPRVMEPFFTTKPVGKGTGLGLSLAKTIAEDHGGTLEYNEDCGHTRFSLILPVARKAEAA
jgi:PAS domain S-box-containing protein